MGKLRLSVISAVALAFALALPANAHAQGQYSVDARGGIAFPVDDPAVTNDLGPSFGLGFTYWINEQLGLRAEGNLDILPGKAAGELTSGVEAPDMKLWSFGGGLDIRALTDDTPWNLNFNVLAGITVFTTDELPSGLDNPAPTAEELDGLSETYFTASGGTTVGYQFTERVSGFVGGQFRYVVADEVDLEVLNQLDDSVEDEPFGEIWTIPVTAGVKIAF